MKKVDYILIQKVWKNYGFQAHLQMYLIYSHLIIIILMEIIITTPYLNFTMLLNMDLTVNAYCVSNTNMKSQRAS